MNKQTEDALRIAIDILEFIEYYPGVAMDSVIDNCKAALENELSKNTRQFNIEQLIEKHKGERTYFDHELIGAYFTVQNLENLIAECVTEQLFGNTEQLEQEPVAWHSPVAYVSKSDLLKIQHRHPPISREKILDDDIPLYTRPTKRLSDDEIVKIIHAMRISTNEMEFDRFKFAHAIEDKLLEINNEQTN